MILENVMYAELRPMLLDKSIPTDDGKGVIDNFGQMELILEAVEEKKAELGKDIDKFPFGLKIIYCTPRSIPKAMMLTEMVHCIDLKLRFPDLICGESHEDYISSKVSNVTQASISWVQKIEKTTSATTWRSL